MRDEESTMKLSLFAIDLLLDLTNDEIKAISRGDSHHGTKEDNFDALTELHEARDFLTAARNRGDDLII